MLKIIPNPENMEFKSGEPLKIESINLSENRLSENAVYNFLSFFRLPQKEENIFFKSDENLGEEEYILDIDNRIEITASSPAGELYALQTLKQILFQTNHMPPKLIIRDKPKHKIRGLMLDVGRYFFSVEDVKSILDKMVLHKLNFFHFHLTEDQGWRIEIDKYPLLTEKGSVRKKTNYNHKPHSGFYTKAEIKEIVEYAHSMCIKVMPEFDIPGHSRAAIACYKNLTCFERNLAVADHWGVKHDVLCAGKDSTIEFVKDVIDEFCELFTDEYFHIGGDEVPKHRWDLCPDCQKRMKELNLSNSEELQMWFMNEMNAYLRKKGKQVFMWSWDIKNDSLLNDSLGFTKCGEMDTKNRPFIDTSTDACYIDLPYGYISLKDSSNHNLLGGNCLGIEATLWSEYVPDIKKADIMMFPRLAPICEIGWSGKTSWNEISNKIDFYYDFIKYNGYGIAPLSKANPDKIRGFFSGLWFEKRQLTWQGISNLFDDKKIEALAKKKK